jgi:hypothetical protein
LLAPIALYPDPLLAQILPASTLPAQVVLADRYVTSGGDLNQIDTQPWDSSVQALAHYPSVLQYLDNNLGWTTELGQAFLNQPQPVMDSIQRLRLSARNFGNLQSTPQEQVVDDGGCIEILPAEPDVIYVPVYQPAYVYYQSGFACGFGAGFGLGVWLDCDFDWHHHNLWFWDRDHSRPANWWRERPDQRNSWMAREGTVWRPEDHRSFSTPPSGDRGWNPGQRTVQAPPARYNAVVNMSKPLNVLKPAATPRPMASPRPEAVRTTPGFHVENPPAPAFHPPATSAFVGSESSHEVKSDSERGHESMQAVTRSEPVRSEPARSEPAVSAPVRSEPVQSPSSEGGGGSHGGGPRR